MSDVEARKQTYFSSSFTLNVDEKRRLQVPKKWRTGEDELVLLLWKTPDRQEACVLVLPPEPYEELVNKIKAMPYSDPKAESLRRWLGKNSAQVAPDKAGRVCLPDWLADKVGISAKGEAVVVGLMDRWQIWSPEAWAPRSELDDEMQAEALKLI